MSQTKRRIGRAQRRAFVRATTHCSAFLPFFWHDLRRGGIRGLDRVEVPVRLVLCRDDWLLPPQRHGAMFRDQLRHVDVVELDDVGHVPMYDDPAGVARLISEHVALWGGAAADRGSVPA